MRYNVTGIMPNYRGYLAEEDRRIIIVILKIKKENES